VLKEEIFQNARLNIQKTLGDEKGNNIIRILFYCENQRFTTILFRFK